MKENEQITLFYYFVIKGVYNQVTNKEGYRVVGIWGNEHNGEGMRIGPTFEEDQLDLCEKLVDELEAKFDLPVKITDIITHFSGIGVGTKLKTVDGDGIVEEITTGPLPFLVRLENGGRAWQNQSYIIKIIK